VSFDGSYQPPRDLPPRLEYSPSGDYQPPADSVDPERSRPIGSAGGADIVTLILEMVLSALCRR
jgi:hypothetical protein